MYFFIQVLCVVILNYDKNKLKVYFCKLKNGNAAASYN